MNIEHGVQFTGVGEDGVFERSVATISNTMNPQVGDTLTHPDGTFKLDSKLGNNGYSSRYVLIPYSGP